MNCESGDVLAQEQVTAAAKEKILDAVGQAATKLRGELGESLATVQKVALDRRNPAATIETLRAAVPLEMGQIAFLTNLSCMYSTYVRGEAYLREGQCSPAAAEFQRILDHRGVVWNCWTGSLAHLGVARAYALESKSSQGADADVARTRALGAYKDFLTLWQDADRDIPVLKQAKGEYAKLK